MEHGLTTGNTSADAAIALALMLFANLFPSWYEWLRMLLGGKPSAPAPTPTPVPQMAAAIKPQPVALEWIGLVSMILTTLLPLIQQVIAAFRARNNREPTPQEVSEIREAVLDDLRKGRRARKPAEYLDAVTVPGQWSDADMEQVTGGASKVNDLHRRAGRTLDSIDRAGKEAEALLKKGGSLFNS